MSVMVTCTGGVIAIVAYAVLGCSVKRSCNAASGDGDGHRRRAEVA